MNPIGVLPLVFALAASAPPPDAAAPVPTAKEQALMEHTCRLVQAGPSHDAYEQCLAARLRSLRADFGPDLSKLSTAARAKIDGACSQAQTLHDREGYLDCLSAQLASLSAAATARATQPPPAAAAPAAPDAAPLPIDATPPDASGSTSSMVGVLAVALTLMATACAVVAFRFKTNRARQVCRVCGAGVEGTADLCPGCRHEAAAAIRQAAVDRAGQKRAAEVEERRLQDEAEAQRLEEQRREELAEHRRLEEARREQEEAARREDAARQEAEQRKRAEAAASFDADESVFDPYLALGVAHGASDEDVRAAYEEAKVKYDPELVADLGYDAKEHFKKKSRAVERAYRMLGARELDDRVIG